MGTLFRLIFCFMYGICLIVLYECFSGFSEAHDAGSALLMVVFAFVPLAAFLLINWHDFVLRMRARRAFFSLSPDERLLAHMQRGDPQYSPDMLVKPPKHWVRYDLMG
jgi:hypothetical protein